MSLSVDVIDKLAAQKLLRLSLQRSVWLQLLAWNSAIQAIFKEIFGSQSDIPAMLGYAAFVTIIALRCGLYTHSHPIFRYAFKGTTPETVDCRSKSK